MVKNGIARRQEQYGSVLSAGRRFPRPGLVSAASAGVLMNTAVTAAVTGWSRICAAAVLERRCRPRLKAVILLPDITNNLATELQEAETKAWDSLGRYKFQMFGYWAGVWVHLNRIGGFNRPNPWKELVAAAREKRDCPAVDGGAV